MNAFSRLIVDIAYSLQASSRYQQSKHFFRNLLDNNSYPYKKYFDYLMVVLIFSSVIILIREVKYHVNDWWLFYNNYIISVAFLSEYLLRMWIYSDVSKIIITQYEKDEFLQRSFRVHNVLGYVAASKLAYMRSATAVIDLLAIVPFFHELRLLRIFILFRVFKLFRYAQSLQHFGRVLASKKFELLTLLMFASMIVSVSAVLIYVMEANDPETKINTLFDAFYWSLVTISTVGFGDMVPVSEAGRAVAMVIIISGIAVLSFSTSIVVTAFTEKLDDIKEEKTIADIKKLKRFYLICGYEEIAQQVASKLRRRGHDVVVLDGNALNVKRAIDHGLIALDYDPGSLEGYQQLGIDFNTQVSAVLCLRDSDVQNVYTALTIRSMNKTVKLLSVLIEQKNRKKLQLAGVNEIVYTQELVGMTAKELSGKPVAFEAIHALRSEENGVHIEEIVIDERTLRSVGFVGELEHVTYRLILMGIYKQEKRQFMFNPIRGTILEAGDILLIIGEKSLIGEFKLFLKKKR